MAEPNADQKNQDEEQPNNIEDADSIQKLMKLSGPKMICLWTCLGIVDIGLIISFTLYSVHHSHQIKGNVEMTYRSIGDAFTLLYRIVILCLCWRFVSELVKGNLSQKQVREYFPDDPGYASLSKEGRSGKSFGCLKMMNFLFSDLELNQFTIAAMLCATHQLYNAILIWIAVYNGAEYWYILSGFTYFVGTFSIAVPGLCFNQFVVYHKKQKNHDLKNEQDSNYLEELTCKSKVLMIKQTVFSSSVVQVLVFIAFVIELLQFCCLPALNHSDLAKSQGKIYHCEDSRCDHRPEFVLCELIFRMFVGIAIFNNLVLLGSVLSAQLHSETSLTNITSIFNPICYTLLFVSLLMDLRTTDHYWDIEYRVINWLWIFMHIIGVMVVLFLLSLLYTAVHQMKYTFKFHPKPSAPLMIEAIILGSFATLSTLFLSVDIELIADFTHFGNLSIWRQWSMIIYHSLQIILLGFTNMIQKFDSFPKKINKVNWRIIRCLFVFIAVINCYDLIYSFMFEAYEYDEMTNGEDIDKEEHNYTNLYQWAYSLSFTVSHLILWSLCCSIEFIVKHDHQMNKPDPLNIRRGDRLNDDQSVNSLARGVQNLQQQGRVRVGSDGGNLLRYQIDRYQMKQRNDSIGTQQALLEYDIEAGSNVDNGNNHLIVDESMNGAGKNMLYQRRMRVGSVGGIPLKAQQDIPNGNIV